MSKQRQHRRRSQGGTTPETKPQNGSGVAQFSVSEVAQFWMSVDMVHRIALAQRQELLGSQQGSFRALACSFKDLIAEHSHGDWIRPDAS